MTGQRGVDLAREIVNGGQRHRSIEIVVHARFKSFKRALSRFTQRVVHAWFGACLTQSRTKVTQAVDRLLGSAQRIEREVELLAIGNTQEKIANTKWRMTLGGQVAQSVVVAF